MSTDSVVNTLESGEEAEPSSPAPTRFELFAAVSVLTVFALTWPVLDLLGRNAEFFLARRSPKSEILVLAVIGTLLIPGVLGLMGILPGRIGTQIGLGLIVVLSSALGFLYLRRLPVSWWLALGAAVVAGALTVWAFSRFASVRTAGRYLLAAPVVMLGVFLFTMPVGAVLREPSATVGNPIPIERPVPIVMVIFDEFPLASIIDPDGELRADRYPNFARLAADGVWFRNAVTVEQQTEHSVPAMLTGSIPDRSYIPVAGQYPFNLFTAIRDQYDMHVHEAITQLCPRALCEGLTSTASSLVRDVGVVAGHVLLPQPLSDDLPAIDRGWGDFAAVTNDFDAKGEFLSALRAGPRKPIDRILSDIRGADHLRPELFYLHALVPHHPWQYLPDGRTYPYIVEANPASRSGGWIDDEFLVAQSMQRHLLQVGYADHVLGELITALEEEGIYEEALMVVVADHGISIRPGVRRQRMITDSTVGDIASVPMFIKAPGFAGGVVDDRRALTIDILPTVADVIVAELPDDVEGVSLFGPAPHRTETTTFGPESQATYGVDGEEKLDVARRIERLFPDGDPWALRPRGSPELIGTRVEPSELEASDIRARLAEARLYADIDTSADIIPARIGGTLTGDVNGTEILAVSVNGVIAAVTRSYTLNGSVSFLAMVPPSYFVEGENSIEIVEVLADGALRAVGEAPS